MTTYLLGVLVSISIFSFLSIGLQLLMGYAGLFTIAHAAIFGVGAYTSAILSMQFGFGFFPSLVCATAAGAALSAVVSLPSLRVTGDYLILVSFGVQELLYSLYINLDDVTGGSGGLQRIPRPEIFGLSIVDPWQYLILYGLFLLAVVWLLYKLVNSPFGLLLKAVREDEIVLTSLGKDVLALKVSAFVISGALAGMAGCFFASYYTFIEPGSFAVEVSVLVMSMVLIGGMGTLWGGLAGAALLIALPEALRFLPFSTDMLGPLRQIAYSALLVLFCFVRPAGIIREKR